MNFSLNSRRGRLIVCLTYLLVLLLVTLSFAGAQEKLDASSTRGKQIYTQGTIASGKPILAYLGSEALEVPGSSMACANCHGVAGQGKPEGGITPSNITWEVLTKPYGLTHSSGRRHPPYTNRAVELALTRGLDPAGNKLLAVMPRYAMSREDMADLIAYLAHVGKDRDPGITETTITLGTLLPAKGPLAEMGEAIKGVTTAYFDDVNKAGGVYNRRIDLKFAETGETADATRINLETLLSEPVFATLGAFIAGSERETLPVFSQKEVPLVGPFTLYPQTSTPINRQVFYLLSGIEGQQRALIEFAAKKPEVTRGGIAIVYPEDQNTLPVVAAMKLQIQRAGLAAPQTLSYVTGRFDPIEAAKQLKQGNRAAVFLLGSSEASLLFLTEAEKLGWFPLIGLSNVGTEIFKAPAGFDGRIFLPLPTSPADQSGEGVNEFRALATKHSLSTRHLAAQISAYSAAKIFVECLKRAGKDLSREKLIQALESLYEHPTGLTPAVTYGPNRRIGAMGAYVITINLKDKQFVPASGWIDLEQAR